MIPPAMQERAAIVAFLRKHTHLEALARLIEAGAYTLSERSLRDRCKREGVILEPWGHST